MIDALRYRWHRHRHPQRHALLRELLPVEGLSHGQLARRQQAALQDIVRFAASHTDYYAQAFAGLDIHRDRPIDIRQLPVLGKQQVLDHRDALLRRDVDPRSVSLGHTGGSTGTPLGFYYDQAKHELMLAGMMRGFMMSGWRPGQRVLYLWGAARDVRGRGVFANALGGLLASERSLAAVSFSERRLAGWLRLIRRWCPVLLYGYASALGELARFMIDSGAAPPRGLLGVYSTAEVLHDGQRTLMEQAFGCKVFNQYGCREVPNIAWECRHGTLHVFSDLVWLESLQRDGGHELLVTSLSNRLMPFIRYALGDSGRLSHVDCPCGLPFPALQTDLCRHNDLITLASGERIHPAYFNQLLYGLGGVRQYQWRQTRRDCLRLSLVTAAPLPPHALQALRSRIRRDLGADMGLQVEYVDQIARTAAGKHRFVIGMDNR